MKFRSSNIGNDGGSERGKSSDNFARQVSLQGEEEHTAMGVHTVRFELIQRFTLQLISACSNKKNLKRNVSTRMTNKMLQ